MRKILLLFKCPQLWSSVVEAWAKSNPTQVFPSLGETEASRHTPVTGTAAWGLLPWNSAREGGTSSLVSR